MFRIKICGVTTAADARLVAEAGADAVGLNFYPQSPRFVQPRDAMHVVAALPEEVIRVGVFVNAELELVRCISDELRLDLIQLHGDESVDYVAELAGRAVMRAFRVGAEGLASVADYMNQCRERHCSLYAVLLDAHRAGTYGGTGVTADWGRIVAEKPLLGDTPLVLAGGLTPDNVAQAIAAVHPAAVDTASGVESSPGKKDAALAQAFATAAAAAFAAAGQPL